jgi:mono/diheme cytochrome c family protein
VKHAIATLALLMAACATGAEPAGKGDAGEQLYAQHCLSCHQSDGFGVPNLQPAITGGAWVKGEVPALAMFVMTGGFNSAERKESESHNVMPAFRHLPDAELAAILTFIRRKFGDGASPVSEADVTAVRKTLPANP